MSNEQKTMNSIYDPKELELRWQKYWQEHQTYKTLDVGEKTYILGMFPYPSGDGLHVGHVRIFTGTDVLSRFFRMNGKRVLHPMGWDAFGLPTENAAIKAKTNPKILSKRNIDNFRRQMQMIGLGYDWSREFATTDPDYYRWTQWLFLKLYGLKNKKGERLLYRKCVPINWCESCKTVLANEEVLADGTHERCGNPVTQRKTDQWLFRITDYADRLLNDLDDLDWPKGILDMQRNWIGKSEGAEVVWNIDGLSKSVTTFTTRLDTIYGATFLVLAPDHPLSSELASTKEAKEYIRRSLQKTEQQRKVEEKIKTGVDTGHFAVHPLTGEKIPIWIADFVLQNYGTGAIMAVPTEDERDVAFAKKFNLPIKNIDIEVDIEAAKKKILFQLGTKAHKKTTYHLRDWIFSRQHYWGEPIPLVYCPKCGDENGVVPVPDNQLPVELPDAEHYESTTTGKSPLSAMDKWVNTTCPKCGGPAKRETDTMPNWAGSCWYFLRFADPKNAKEAFSERSMKEFLPVDWYLGGAEHAVLHLLYARFWVKALQDLGLLSIGEPFSRLRSVGMVLGAGHVKMSKSLGNVLNPDDIVSRYGADTLRIYEMFMGPWDQAMAWNERGVVGAYRFLERVHRLIFIKDGKVGNETSKLLISLLHRLNKKIAHDIPEIKFNTAIAAMMKFINVWDEGNMTLSRHDVGVFAQLLAPFAPHLAEDIWAFAGNDASVHLSQWPIVDMKQTIEHTIELPVQVNGKTRAILSVAANQASDEQAVVGLAKQLPNVERYLSGKQLRRHIFVAGKTVNFVIR